MTRRVRGGGSRYTRAAPKRNSLDSEVARYRLRADVVCHNVVEELLASVAVQQTTEVVLLDCFHAVGRTGECGDELRLDARISFVEVVNIFQSNVTIMAPSRREGNGHMQERDRGCQILDPCLADQGNTTFSGDRQQVLAL